MSRDVTGVCQETSFSAEFRQGNDPRPCAVSTTICAVKAPGISCTTLLAPTAYTVLFKTCYRRLPSFSQLVRSTSVGRGIWGSHRTLFCSCLWEPFREDCWTWLSNPNFSVEYLTETWCSIRILFASTSRQWASSKRMLAGGKAKQTQSLHLRPRKFQCGTVAIQKRGWNAMKHCHTHSILQNHSGSVCLNFQTVFVNL